MVAVQLITTLAQKETARQALLNQLRDADASSPHMPASLEVDGDEAQAALADLLATGTIKEARAGRYYLSEPKTKEANPGIAFVVLLAILIVVSFAASMLAVAITRG